MHVRLFVRRRETAPAQTGRPNVDWCEDHKDEVLRVNVVGTLSLADLCNQRGIHMTNFGASPQLWRLQCGCKRRVLCVRARTGTGCIYSYDAAHPLGSGRGFTETDAPNFAGSFYSMTKGHVQKVLPRRCPLLRGGVADP